MWRPSIAATRRYVPEVDRKLAFDKFHGIRLLGHAVDLVSRAEHRALAARGEATLAGTRYWWLTNPERMDAQRWRAFRPLRASTLKTARAWALKEMASSLWGYVRRGWAAKGWAAWLAWALRCPLAPMRTVAETIKKYLWGILNAVISRATNALADVMASGGLHA